MEGTDKFGEGSGDRVCIVLQTKEFEFIHQDHCEALKEH